MSDLAPFDVERFASALSTRAVGREFRYESELPSTMDVAREMAGEGAPHGALVLAETQTAGRGRRGRDFYSPPGGSLYFTVILRPSPPEHGRLPLTVPLAVCRACAGEGVDARIKWPNDIWVGERKLSGMLIDGESGPAGTTAYVGIGINVNADPTAEPALRESTTSLARELGREVVRETLLARVCDELETAVAEPPGALAEAYRGVSLLLGRAITVEEGGASYGAWARDIAADGALEVELENGTQRRLMAADVSVRRA